MLVVKLFAKKVMKPGSFSANSHLFQFCQQTGLGYDPNGTVGIGELWERLKGWYIDNGTLTIEVSDKGKEKDFVGKLLNTPNCQVGNAHPTFDLPLLLTAYLEILNAPTLVRLPLALWFHFVCLQGQDLDAATSNYELQADHRHTWRCNARVRLTYRASSV